MLISVKKFFFFWFYIKCSKYEDKKLSIWQHFLIRRAYPFVIFMFCPSERKNCIITGLVSKFFHAPCKRVTSSLQKRKHQKFYQKTAESKSQTNFFFSFHISFRLEVHTQELVSWSHVIINLDYGDCVISTDFILLKIEELDLVSSCHRALDIMNIATDENDDQLISTEFHHRKITWCDLPRTFSVVLRKVCEA